jgi:nitrous oxidase accessory protein
MHVNKILFGLLFFLSLSVYGKTITICNECSLNTIKKAILNSEENDTIVVKKGTYKEYNIVVNKPLTIIGEGYPVIDGELKGEIFTIISDNVTLDGLKIINVGTSYTDDYAAVRVIKSKNFLIQNMLLEKLFFGIYLEKASDGRVYNNNIVGDAKEEYNSGNGIQLWYCQNIEIDNNLITHVRDGIYLEFSDFCKITNNQSKNNVRYGLHFMFSNNDLYQNNTFENNGAGVAVMFSKGIEMYENVFKNNWGPASYGVLLKEINDSEIIGNTFENNTVGINIEGSNRINYKNNDFISNGWAIKSRGACYTNHFINNNFLYNSFDLAYNSKLNDNIFAHNYWSNYSGYDLDKNGVGDVPYRPVKLFSYVVNRTPESIILLRSLFVEIIDFSEKVSPVFTPENLMDSSPKMKRIHHDQN